MYAAKIKSAAVWAFAFTGFTIAFSGAYGAWNSSMSSTSSGSLLSAAGWNAIVDNVLELKSRTDSLSGTVSTLQTQVVSGTAGKYHLEATKATVNATVPVDMSIVNALCKDGDGCDVTVGMKDWDNAQVGMIASRGPYKLYMSKTSNAWRLSNDAQGNDGNGTVEHILGPWDCYFTDGQYVGASGSDPAVGFGLMNYNSAYGDPDMVCTLDIDD